MLNQRIFLHKTTGSAAGLESVASARQRAEQFKFYRVGPRVSYPREHDTVVHKDMAREFTSTTSGPSAILGSPLPVTKEPPGGACYPAHYSNCTQPIVSPPRHTVCRQQAFARDRNLNTVQTGRSDIPKRFILVSPAARCTCRRQPVSPYGKDYD